MSALPGVGEQGCPEQGAPTPLHAGFVLGLDVGSSVIRCHVYDREARIRGSSTQKVESLYPQPGWVEYDPDSLWVQFVAVIKEAIKAAGVEMNQIVSLGISTQRATFITWNKKTGNHFHNFISWQDLRATDLVKSWNHSFLIKYQNFNTRSLKDPDSLSFYRERCKGQLKKKIAALGRLTRGCCISSQKVLNMPQIFQMPVQLDFLTRMSHNFGTVDEEIFGVPIPITALVADQQSAMFGECCFHTGDVKLTMGTGTFLDINTGNNPQQSVGGFYPLIGWKIGQEVVCLAEGNAGDTGSAIKWAQQLNLFTDAAETEKMAKHLEDSEGVYFVPSFSGLQAPLNDPRACASFMGLKPSTSKYHLVRAILESIAFRNKQLYEVMQKEIHIPITKIRADGGVCKNSFVMQMTSDLINQDIDRPVQVDMSCRGAASLAGLAVGFWADKEELTKLRQSETVFKPQKKWQEYEMSMENWVKAVRRSMNWYTTT